MLYGDDDTFFFIDNILELLQDFDPNMPYIITGTLRLAVAYQETGKPLS